MNLPGVSCLLRLKRTESTQKVARILAESGAENGTLVWADSQSAGRGRMSRRWDSAPGGLYFSLILMPKFPPSRLTDLSLMTARAAAKALATLTGIKTAVKPPNDVLGFDGTRPKKICGILAEASGDSRKLDWVILGIGINVNNSPRANGASSLKSLTGRSWDVSGVLKSLLTEFHKFYGELTSATAGDS